jgi:hypothetical protein
MPDWETYKDYLVARKGKAYHGYLGEIEIVNADLDIVRRSRRSDCYLGDSDFKDCVTFHANGDVTFTMTSFDTRLKWVINQHRPRGIPQLIRRSKKDFWEIALSKREDRMQQCSKCHGAWKPEREIYRMFSGVQPTSCECSTYRPGAYRELAPIREGSGDRELKSREETLAQHPGDEWQGWRPAGYLIPSQYATDETNQSHLERNASLVEKGMPEGWTPDNPYMNTGMVMRKGGTTYLPFLSGERCILQPDGTYLMPGMPEPATPELVNEFVDEKGVFTLP